MAFPATLPALSQERGCLRGVRLGRAPGAAAGSFSSSRRRSDQQVRPYSWRRLGQGGWLGPTAGGGGCSYSRRRLGQEGQLLLLTDAAGSAGAAG